MLGQTVHVIKTEYPTREKALEALCVKVSNFFIVFLPKDKKVYKVTLLENNTILTAHIEEW